MISNGQSIETVPSIVVESIDSTGAGDAFVGATLYQLAREAEPKRVLEDFEQLKKIIAFSNKVGALVCTKVGPFLLCRLERKLLVLKINLLIVFRVLI